MTTDNCCRFRFSFPPPWKRDVQGLLKIAIALKCAALSRGHRFLISNDQKMSSLFQDLRAVPSGRRGPDLRRDGVGTDRPLLLRSQDPRSLRTFPSER